MRHILILLIFLFSSFFLKAETYYVAPNGGSDSYTGLDSIYISGINGPWATWQKAFNTAIAGDTVYLRGGVWYHEQGESYQIIPGDGIGHSGTDDNYIHYFNYPGEIPILDGTNFVPTEPPNGGYSYGGGLYLDGVHYIHWKGITIRNFYQVYDSVFVTGIVASESNFQIFENITIHNVQGRGIYYSPYYAPDSTYFLNMDVYDCGDVRPLNDVIGGWGDGYIIGVEAGSYMLIDGCRSWNNTDDGFNLFGKGLIEIRNSWSFSNGPGLGDGSGFKLNPTVDSTYTPLTRILTNNIAAFNDGNTGCGFNENNDGSSSLTCQIYNNTSYGNDIGFMTFGWIAGEYHVNDYRNNIAYASRITNIDLNSYAGGQLYYDITNSWTEGNTYNITNDDFLVSDSITMIAQLTAARKSDNSLPNIDLFKLTPNSELIDAGTDVDLPYYGLAPDLGYSEYSTGPQIIANHSVVDDYEYIPQYYIDSVKKMWLAYAGESHARAIGEGLELLELIDTAYKVSYLDYGTIPESYTDTNLRASHLMWGDLDNATGWIYFYGEEDWYTSATAITRTKAGLDYYNTTGPLMSALGFGWCWDPAELSSDMDDYVDATEEYINHIKTNNYPTKIFFTTGPLDGAGGTYDKYLSYEFIRNSVDLDTTRILFDYADILSYDNGSDVQYTITESGYTIPAITTTNIGDGSIGHISEVGAVRLAKAMWWMLARMAGWDGNVAVYSEASIDSTLTDILTFTLPTQTGAATINTTNHTVLIEVSHLATVTNLTPYISLSYGATISPTNMTSRDFTTPQTYTVTALDGTTTQQWTVTVTQAEEPPVPSSNSGVRIGSKWAIHGTQIVIIE